MSKPNYVLATDADFEEKQGWIYYKGQYPYVEIPHIIHGRSVTNLNGRYTSMFCRGNKVDIKGIKSTNKKIKSIDCLFANMKTSSLDLTEFDFSGVESADSAFSGAKINNIIFPKNNFLNLTLADNMFSYLKTDTFDISDISFSKVKPASNIITCLLAKKIILPSQDLDILLSSDIAEDDDWYFPLESIPAESQTEDICWAAVKCNKYQGKFVKIKSKKILMYLGTNCPDYIDFYYDN